MANSDYTIDGSGNFASFAKLSSAITEADSVIHYYDFHSAGAQITAGTMLLVGTEIMRVDEFRVGSIVVGRGCGDSIPKAHASGLPIWFIVAGNMVGRNKTSYVNGDEIGVKPLPRTSSKPALAIERAPADGLTFTGRFARPYPPGQVQANASPWYTSGIVIKKDAPLTITWAHRDRVVQADQLVSHDEASVGPEAGTTYTVRLRRSDRPNEVVKEYNAVQDTSFVYDMATARQDFNIAGETAVETYGPTAITSTAQAGAAQAFAIGAYVYGLYGYVLYKMNAADLTPVASVSLHPSTAKVITDGTYIYAVNSGNPSSGQFGRVWKYDADLNPLDSAGLPQLGDGNSICYGAGSLWVALGYSLTVRRMDPATLATIADLNVSAGALDSDGTYVYASSETIRKIDPATNTVVMTVPGALGYCVGEPRVVGQYVWTSEASRSTNEKNLNAYDKDTGALADHAITGAFGNLGRLDNYLTVLDSGNGTVSVIDASTLTLYGRFQIANIAASYNSFNAPAAVMLDVTRFIICDTTQILYYDRAAHRTTPDIAFEMIAELLSKRDGLESREHYSMTFNIVYEEPYGLGYRLGESLGGVTP